MTEERDPVDWFAAEFAASPDEPESQDAAAGHPARPVVPPPAAAHGIPVVPTTPLTPTPPPADEPVAFAWGLTPGGGAATTEPAAAPGPVSAQPAAPAPSFEPPAAAPPAPHAPPLAPPVAAAAFAPPAAPASTWSPPADSGAAPAPAHAAPGDAAALSEPPIVPWTPPPDAPAAPRPTESQLDVGPPTAAFTPPLDSWTTPSFDPALEGPTEAFAAEPVGADVPEDESLAPSAIDALFGEAQFREYDDQPLLLPSFGAASQQQASNALVVQPIAAPQATAPGLTRAQRVLLWVAGGLVAAIALVGLFVLGTRLAGTLGTPSDAITSPEPVEPALPATGPLPPGEHAWDLLRGGECVSPFESAWQESYAVVDCATPHAAQLVARATFADATGAAYPGIEELAALTAELCTTPAVIDYAAVGGVTDLQLLASFAADETEWSAGHHDYFCFAHRASGEPLTTSIATTPAP